MYIEKSKVFLHFGLGEANQVSTSLPTYYDAPTTTATLRSVLSFVPFSVRRLLALISRRTPNHSLDPATQTQSERQA